MNSCLGHILESTKGIEIKLGTYIDVRKTRTIILSYILLELSLFITFHKRWFSLSCLGVQVVFDYNILTFSIDNRHLGSDFLV